MSGYKLHEAAQRGDTEAITQLLAGGGDVDELDEQGWTPLNWAAGKGDVTAVRLLLEKGADVTRTGRDNRTPLMIAKAAGHAEAAALLAAAEKAKGVWEDPRLSRPYCRAHYLKDLRAYPAWSESRINWKEEDTLSEEVGGAGQAAVLADDDIAYLHQDLTVTKSIWHEESVIFNQVTPEWREFCEQTLGFAIPDDLV